MRPKAAIIASSPLALALFVGCNTASAPSSEISDLGQYGPKDFCTAATADDAPCEREAEVAERFEAVREDPEALRGLLLALPKGGDLHSHLSGAVQTEKLIEWSIEDELCVRESSLKLTNCTTSSGNPTSGAVPVADVPTEELLAAWSMEGFEGTVKEGHDHFFATFGRFGKVTRNHTADMLAAVRSNAAAHGESYLELMLALGTFSGGRAAEPYVEDMEAWDAPSLLAAREAIVQDEDFQENLVATAEDLASAIDESEQILGCEEDGRDPGCEVEVRFLVQVWRAASRESVVGQVVHAYELGQIEPRIVGLNLAGAEDHSDAIEGYLDVMAALATMRESYGNDFHVALHAGELVPSLLDEEHQDHLTFHIREAVLTAGAERIGHGIDILSETSEDFTSEQLLEAMRERDVAVEICLSSNEFILGVDGPDHPMGVFLDAGVPLAIATDDEGVARSSMTDELLDAVVEQELDYRQVKQLVRRSLHHSFADGDRLFETLGPSPELSCSTAGACQELTAESDRSRLQFRLERQLVDFEKSVLASD